MMVDDARFFAWLDGELDAAAAAEVEAAVAADERLTRMAEEHRALGRQLRTTFDAVVSTPVSLEAYKPQPGGNVVSMARARVVRLARKAPTVWQQAAAMAAVFVLGIVTSDLLPSKESSPIAPESGRLVAAASLEDALYTRLASQPADEGPRIGVTFRDRSGNVCRTFVDATASGLACHDQGDWRLRAVFQAPEGQGGDYRMAAGADPDLAELVDSTIAGDAFDAAQEKAARDRGWR